MSLVHAGGCLTRVSLEGGGLELDSGSKVGCLSISAGGIKAVASTVFQ